MLHVASVAATHTTNTEHSRNHLEQPKVAVLHRVMLQHVHAAGVETAAAQPG